MSIATIKSSIQGDIKKIAADVVVVGGAVTGVLVLLIALGPVVHIPAATIAIAASASAVVTSIVNQARRYTAQKAAAKAAAK